MNEQTENSVGLTNSIAIRKELPTVEVEQIPSDPVPTDEETEKVLEELGLAKLPKTTLAAFGKLGVYFKGNGVVKTVRGEAFLARSILLSALMAVNNQIERGVHGKRARPLRPDEMCEALRSIATAVGKLTDSHKVMLQTDPKKPGVVNVLDDEEPKGKSFPTGNFMPIKAEPGSTVNVTMTEKGVAKPMDAK